ncbi:murein biosynthesis integral membrane protein MurJ [Microbacterium sp. JZ31]|uniref:murein biosynthesis integral membrane protein MurJ n=1 Tax=Microbacterium sp. JZ31 TaxID=1906274 RepID=UPI001933682C|nr:murein biosynthesis integral membrane protein MurJ [Microbacterium sp. JZ31]
MHSIGRASAMIAAGTLVSRVTGLLRATVLVLAIGSIGHASDAFAIANQLPNYIFQVISAGVLTAVIVPQVVKWSGHEDGGQAYISKFFTLAAVILLGVTALAMLCAPLLVTAFSARFIPEQHALATAFALWCLPQILFYGMFALLGETLNARRVFGPYAWAPIANNVVSIAGFLLFMALFGSNRNEVEYWDATMIAVLGGLTTLGIVSQTALLLFFWRRTGLRVRLDFGWRGMGLGEIRNLAGWTVAMLLVGLVVSGVQQNVISGASGQNAATAAWYNAWLIFMLPYSIIVMSIGTPYFTQLSEHASAGRDSEVRADIGRAVRTLGLLVVIAATAVIVAAVPAARIIANSPGQAVALAPVLIGFLVGLVPLAVQFVVQRAFYAYGDTRTPFFFTVFQAAIAIGLALLMPLFVPQELLAASVAAAQSLSSLAQVILASWLLHRRLGSLGMAGNLWALARFTLAAVPAGAAGWGVYLLSGAEAGWMTAGMFQGAVGVCVVGAVALLVYVAILAIFRAPELRAAFGLVRRLVGR